jgi:hypothetical protein
MLPLVIIGQRCTYSSEVKIWPERLTPRSGGSRLNRGTESEKGLVHISEIDHEDNEKFLERFKRCRVRPTRISSVVSVWAAEAKNYPAELAELCLMHSVGSAVHRAYQRSDLFEKRRDIMRDWNDTMFKRHEKVIAFA